MTTLTLTRPAPLAHFRSMMSAFPSGVAVVTTYDRDGIPRGLTASSLASVTAEPPTVSVCLNTAGDTLQALREHGSFAVNLLHTGGRRAAGVFATPNIDRFSEVDWRPSPGLGLPWLVEDAFVTAECEVAGMLEVGTHTLVLGTLVEVAQEAGTPLLYGGREFADWPGGDMPGRVPLA
ncbi:flavin reductase family protein [Streptomyces sp. NPDC002054]|uniref:flavin reductase family protein n=1 Tax=Streptomyces sp. NPDC002054 TaxID=3154663 RepID=UPI0033183570